MVNEYSIYTQYFDTFTLYLRILNSKTPHHTYLDSLIILILRFEQVSSTPYEMSQKCDRMANCVDPNQTAPLGAVWSGFTLFAQVCLSQNLG